MPHVPSAPCDDISLESSAGGHNGVSWGLMGKGPITSAQGLRGQEPMSMELHCRVSAEATGVNSGMWGCARHHVLSPQTVRLPASVGKTGFQPVPDLTQLLVWWRMEEA